MAWTTTKVAQWSNGNLVQQLWQLEADSATLQLDTGLSTVIGASCSLASAATGAEGKLALNKGVTSTAIAGSIGISGVASGSRLFMSVYGR
jgi:hypothetical protein